MKSSDLLGASSVDEVLGEAERIAADALSHAHDALLLEYRFMNRPLANLPTRIDPKVQTCASSAREATFSPAFALQSLRGHSPLLARGYLHMTLHCLLHHAFPPAGVNPLRWSTACDVAVCATLRELETPLVALPDEERERRLDEILQRAENPTASGIYALFTREQVPDDHLFELSLLFGMDSHELWFDDDGSTEPEQSETRSELKERWEKIARQTELDMISDDADDASASLSTSLSQLEAEPMGLEELLRQYMAPYERIRVNDDEFDYVYYTYGLQIYGNIPLIEPLEYSDAPEIRDFAVVIDTSGSVNRDLVELFVRKACGMLLSSGCIGEQSRIRLLQCDCAVQDEACLCSEAEVEAYLGQCDMKGRGSTDFRPAFARIDHLVESGEIAEMAGLIYFTDGLGTFPEDPPNYDAAFVFVDELREVPAWATAVLTYADDLR